MQLDNVCNYVSVNQGIKSRQNLEIFEARRNIASLGASIDLSNEIVMLRFLIGYLKIGDPAA